MTDFAHNDFPPLKAPPRRRVRMRCTGWRGQPPRRGDYLHSRAPRARIAYRVLLMKWKWHEAQRLWKGPLWCIRLPIADIPAGARVHTWESARRKQPMRSPLL